jgi:hypothetical protein
MNTKVVPHCLPFCSLRYPLLLAALPISSMPLNGNDVLYNATPHNDTSQVMLGLPPNWSATLTMQSTLSERTAQLKVGRRVAGAAAWVGQ